MRQNENKCEVDSRAKSSLQSDQILKNIMTNHKLNVNFVLQNRSKSQDHVPRKKSADSKNHVIYNIHLNARKIKISQIPKHHATVEKSPHFLEGSSFKAKPEKTKRPTFHSRKFKIMEPKISSINNLELDSQGKIPSASKINNLEIENIGKMLSKTSEINNLNVNDQGKILSKTSSFQINILDTDDKGKISKTSQGNILNEEDQGKIQSKTLQINVLDVGKGQIIEKDEKENLKEPENLNSNDATNKITDIIIKRASKTLDENVINPTLKQLPSRKLFASNHEKCLKLPNSMIKTSKTMELETKPFFSPAPPLQKSLTKTSNFLFTQNNVTSRLPFLHQSSEEIESPSRIVEKIYTNMRKESQNGNSALITPQKIEYSSTSRKNRDRIISRSTVPGRKELGKSKNSRLKKRFIKEYFYPKEEEENTGDNNENSKFQNVIFSDLSINALASHKWRKKTAQNNAYFIKSFSPDFIDYPNSPKCLEYDEFVKNFNRVEKDNKYCLSKQNFNRSLGAKKEGNYMDFLSPNGEYLKSVSQHEKRNKLIYGMSFYQYEDVIDLWKVDHFKGELPDIGQAYDYMKIIKNNKRENENNEKKEKKKEKEDSKSRNKSLEFSPKTTNRSGLQLAPKKDALQMNLLSPTEKNITSSFFSPSNNTNILKRRSPRFSVQSPSMRRSTRSPLRRTEIQLFSLI